MPRVVRDHLASGYLSRVDYRAIKEPEQETDYLIRYYPGEGAGESIGRIQAYITARQSRKRLTNTTWSGLGKGRGADRGTGRGGGRGDGYASVDYEDAGPGRATHNPTL